MRLTLKLDERIKGLTDKGFPIIVYASHNYKQAHIRLGYFSHKKDWNTALAVPKKSHPDYFLVLDYVNIIKERITNILKDSHKTEIKVPDIKGLIFKKNSDIFYDTAMERYNENYRGTDWSALRSFEREFPRMNFKDVTAEVAQLYARRLLDKGNKPAGVDSYVRSLRAVWNKLGKENNPFKVRIDIPKKVKPAASEEDLIKLKNGVLPYGDGHASLGNLRDYFLLMFYLGGIDPEVLAKLRYDVHVVQGRIQFNRDKGQSKALCNNIIPEEAWEILKGYDCKPYLVPIFKANKYRNFMSNFARKLKLISGRLELSINLIPKSGRYTFINKAEQELVDFRLTSQIVGHKVDTQANVYSNNYPLKLQDETHLSIIKLGK